MNLPSHAHTAIHPRGDAIVKVQPYGDGHLGAVTVGDVVTIQSTDPRHLLQLADALDQAAEIMLAGQRKQTEASA